MPIELRRWVTHYTPGGVLYRLWERNVPRIADFIMDCSVYLYQTEIDARDGVNYGGSGFLVHIPTKSDPARGYIYAVTNKHVIDHDCGVLRLSKKNGGIDTISTQYSDWFLDADGDDLAVLPMDIKDFFRWWSVPVDRFVTRELIEAYNIGYGDEAFMVGRLENHAGKQKNTPIIRFGNVSLMADPSEPIAVAGGREQEGFLVECRSLSGFSGSPVFVSTEQTYRGVEMQELIQGDGAIVHSSSDGMGGAINKPVMLHGTYGPWLLGIDWGHVPIWKPVFDAKIDDISHYKPDHWVQRNSGIACVLPAWHIMDTLNVEVLVKEREREEKEIAKKAQHATVNDLGEKDEPFTKKDFEDALKKATRKTT
jgi:hypothetical protein